MLRVAAIGGVTSIIWIAARLVDISARIISSTADNGIFFFCTVDMKELAICTLTCLGFHRLKASSWMKEFTFFRASIFVKFL